MATTTNKGYNPWDELELDEFVAEIHTMRNGVMALQFDFTIPDHDFLFDTTLSVHFQYSMLIHPPTYNIHNDMLIIFEPIKF
jgi:hypothetical protein